MECHLSLGWTVIVIAMLPFCLLATIYDTDKHAVVFSMRAAITRCIA
jgi:hypothetical protein